MSNLQQARELALMDNTQDALRYTEWMDAKLKVSKSSYLTDGEVRITNLEWCKREVVWQTTKHRRAAVVAAGKYCAVFFIHSDRDIEEVANFEWGRYASEIERKYSKANRISTARSGGADNGNPEGNSGDGCATVKP